MNTTEDPRRPYASPSNVIQVIQRARTRNLPDKVDDDFLRVAGIGDAVHGRVLEALRFLDLIHPDGQPTETLIAISGAPEEEYRALLGTAIQEAYAEDLQRGIDPAQDTQAQIVDAFRRYQPRSQTSRMVMFLLAMCREAGLPVSEAPRERGMRSPTARKTPAKAIPPHQRTRKDRGKRAEPPREDPPPTTAGALFGVTEQDIALLDESEFEEVWGALGKVARARARASLKAPATEESPDETDEGGQI